MTTVDNAQLPTFGSVEEMAIWAAMILNELYPTVKVTEDIERAPELVAQVQGYDLAIPQDNDWTYNIDSRCVIRLSIPLDSTWKRAKLWQAAADIGASATPTEYYS